MVDDIDYEWAKDINWTENDRGYLQYKANGKSLFLHIIILQKMGYDMKDKKGDHKDRNSYNNLRFNLRSCIPQQNACNTKIHLDNNSGYKGVNFHKKTNKFRAYITFKGITMHLGLFNTAEEAAFVYNKAAIRYHGEFAVLNKIGD